MDEIYPIMLADCVSAEDNKLWKYAMNGPYVEEYWRATEVKLDNIERKMDPWDIVYCNEKINFLQCTWKFKCKYFPDVAEKKFRERFCARGDQHI